MRSTLISPPFDSLHLIGLDVTILTGRGETSYLRTPDTLQPARHCASPSAGRTRPRPVAPLKQHNINSSSKAKSEMKIAWKFGSTKPARNQITEPDKPVIRYSQASLTPLNSFFPYTPPSVCLIICLSPDVSISELAWRHVAPPEARRFPLWFLYISNLTASQLVCEQLLDGHSSPHPPSLTTLLYQPDSGQFLCDQLPERLSGLSTSNGDRYPRRSQKA
ncbi:hypothetical protein RRG08_022392 [Elysia crispata]|uniref:Uncharacterized protein n=1 Tax=Elysia crispata TaxID=231223 RepID=A0AAE0Z1J4_9GAST|nr:hypothetical protein RRG08_022392 [Elysia crispata]